MYFCGVVIAIALIRYLPEFLMSISKHDILTVSDTNILVSRLSDRIYYFSGPDSVIVELDKESNYISFISEESGHTKISLNIIYDATILLSLISSRTSVKEK